MLDNSKPSACRLKKERGTTGKMTNTNLNLIKLVPSYINSLLTEIFISLKNCRQPQKVEWTIFLYKPLNLLFFIYLCCQQKLEPLLFINILFSSINMSRRKKLWEHRDCDEYLMSI